MERHLVTLQATQLTAASFHGSRRTNTVPQPISSGVHRCCRASRRLVAHAVHGARKRQPVHLFVISRAIDAACGCKTRPTLHHFMFHASYLSYLHDEMKGTDTLLI